MMKIIILILVSCIIIVCGSVQLTQASELRPLNLPSTQQGHLLQPQTVERSTPNIYATFEEKVRSMDSQQIEAYRQRYTRALDAAANNRDYKKVEHYSRLLKILEEY